VTRRKLVKGPTAEIVKNPAEYETITKLVVDEPAKTLVTEIPPVYERVKVQRLVEPASESRSEVPDEVITVSRTVQVSDGRLEWKQILCETNVTPSVIGKLQDALYNAGFYEGNIDGALGPQTMAGVRAFQRENNLASGQLTIETLKALGVIN
jgi:hypothetical protein